MRVAAEFCLRRGQLVHGPVEKAHVHQPPHDVLAAIAARRTAGPGANAQVNLAPALIQLLSDLAAGLARTDDQHGTGRQLLRIPIVAGMDLHNTRRQVGADGQGLGLLKEAASNDYVRCLVIACGCRDSIPAVHRFYCQGACSETDRCLETLGISLQVLDDLGSVPGIRQAHRLHTGIPASAAASWA